jgi:hypothetical protein
MIVVSSAFPGHGKTQRFRTTGEILRWLLKFAAADLLDPSLLSEASEPARFHLVLDRLNSVLMHWQLSEPQFAEIVHLHARYLSFRRLLTERGSNGTSAAAIDV